MTRPPTQRISNHLSCPLAALWYCTPQKLTIFQRLIFLSCALSVAPFTAFFFFLRGGFSFESTLGGLTWRSQKLYNTGGKILPDVWFERVFDTSYTCIILDIALFHTHSLTRFSSHSTHPPFVISPFHLHLSNFLHSQLLFLYTLPLLLSPQVYFLPCFTHHITKPPPHWFCVIYHFIWYFVLFKYMLHVVSQRHFFLLVGVFVFPF